MTVIDPELATSKVLPKTPRPRDAATLILVRRDGPVPRILMGRRHGGHAFMPNMYVFPGGRLDPSDCRMAAVTPLDPAVESRLATRMRGRTSLARARGLALAAVRETFEEVGLIIGRPCPAGQRAPSQDWKDFLDTGHAPDLSSLRFVMRAITPPGRTRRFDTRFFLAEASAVANLDSPCHPGSGELLESNWFSLSETLGLELPSVTRDVLKRVEAMLQQSRWPDPAEPVPFHYHRHGKWLEDNL
jgi:8-oxo-dGTP pyrophosphatase MutT (NUDIX family)